MARRIVFSITIAAAASMFPDSPALPGNTSLRSRQLWACRGGRRCQPSVYYSTTTMCEGDIPRSAFVTSRTYPDEFVRATRAGMALVANFLGVSSDLRVYLLAHGESSYSDISTDFCKWAPLDQFCQLPDSVGAQSEIEAAKKGQDIKITTTRLICNCGTTYLTGSAVFIITNPKRERPNRHAWVALHEYTHTFQNAFGYFPAWAMEGGALFMQCFFAKTMGIHPSFSECMRNSAASVVGLYKKFPGVNFMTKYAADWCNCPQLCTADNIRDTYSSEIYYDLGVIATLYAIDRGLACSGKTMLDYWTSDDGFWRQNVPVAGDSNKDWASDVEEGTGWKQALASYTGDASVSAFYMNFEAWVSTASVDDIVALAAHYDDTVEEYAKVRYSAQGKKYCPAGSELPCPTCRKCKKHNDPFLNHYTWPTYDTCQKKIQICQNNYTKCVKSCDYFVDNDLVLNGVKATCDNIKKHYSDAPTICDGCRCGKRRLGTNSVVQRSALVHQCTRAVSAASEKSILAAEALFLAMILSFA